MRGIRFVVTLVALLVSTLVTGGTAVAADVQPTVTMDPIAPIVYRGEMQQFVAHVTGGPGGVVFQISYDGTTWETLTGSSQGGGPGSDWYSSTIVPDTQPLGQRWIRAHYYGEAGFLPADSEPQEQTVARRQAEILNFGVISSDWPLILPDSQIRLVATGNRGAVRFDRLIDGSWTEVDGVTFISFESAVDIGALGEGSHTFRARIDDSLLAEGVTEEKVIDVAKAATIPDWSTPRTVEAHHSLEATVGVSAATLSGLKPGGSITVRKVSTRRLIAHGSNPLTFTLAPLPVGSHLFRVAYSGNENFAPSSETFTVTVTPDTVEASDVAIQYTTFYPYKDTYRDTLRITGQRQEAISVAMNVYSPGGALVKSATIGQGTGSYAYTWTGRNSAGNVLASGKYKVVQTLRDAFGTTKTFTNYVNLSHKRLVTKTKYVTKSGSSYSSKGRGGTGKVSISSSGYAKLYAGSDGWASTGYEFTIPAATAYKSIAFQAYAKAGPAPSYNELGMQDFSECLYQPEWNLSCFDQWERITGRDYSKWYSTSGSVTRNRSDRHVRGAIVVVDQTLYVYKVRVKVVYAVLE